MAKINIGLDIGTHSVKLVQMQVGGDTRRVLNYSIQDIYGPEMDYDLEGPPNRLVSSAIKEAFKEIKVNPKRVKNLNTAMGGNSISVNQITSIPLAPEELESSLIFEARKHLPLDDSEPLIDYQILKGDMDSEQVSILLAATTRKAFQSRLEMLKDIGLKPHIIDSEMLALLNSYILTQGPLQSPPTIFLNVGAKSTNLIICGGEAKFFARDIQWAGFSFTDDIRDNKDVDYPTAEKIKRDEGIFGLEEGISGDSGIRMQRKFTQDSLVSEILRSLRYYAKETSVREFDKVLLSGGSARIDGLAGFLTEKLNIPVEIYDPTHTFELPQVFNPQHAPQLATAFGLALRED
jgi:type IV pilus assembly protein PilM